ncbi:unnamed protein product, partial [Acidithrix sp. C25]
VGNPVQVAQLSQLPVDIAQSNYLTKLLGSFFSQAISLSDLVEVSSQGLWDSNSLMKWSH